MPYITCPLCGEQAWRRDFNLFCKDGRVEKYGIYKCHQDHQVDLWEKTDREQMNETSYKRFSVLGNTGMQCVTCSRMADHISDDVTTDPDVIHHHKRYACRGTPTHVFRILHYVMHNDNKKWKEFDRKVFGYDTGDDLPDGTLTSIPTGCR